MAGHGGDLGFGTDTLAACETDHNQSASLDRTSLSVVYLISFDKDSQSVSAVSSRSQASLWSYR